MRPLSSGSVGDEFLAALAQCLAARTADVVLQRLRQEPGFGAPLYATAKHNPLGSRKAFLSAARRGAFKTFRRGREVAAHWKDVEEWMLKSQDIEGEPSTLEHELALASKPRARRRKAA